MRKLTASQKEEVIKRRRAGEKLDAIAQSYAVSEPAIHKIVKGLVPDAYKRRSDARLNNEQVLDAIERRKNGESLQVIGKSYNVSATIIHRVTKHALPAEGWSARAKMTEVQKSEAIARRSNGETLKEIAASFSVSEAWIHRITSKAIPPKK